MHRQQPAGGEFVTFDVQVRLVHLGPLLGVRFARVVALVTCPNVLVLPSQQRRLQDVNLCEARDRQQTRWT